MKEMLHYCRWAIPLAALFYLASWFDGGGFLYNTFGPSPMPMSLVSRASIPNYPQPVVVDVAVWPDSVRMQTGDQQQFYASFLMSDGTVECTDAQAQSIPSPWTNAAACDSATALLDFTLVQDTSYVRFIWELSPDAANFDSLVYHMLVRTGDSTQYLADLPAAHPVVSMDWKNGVPNTFYEVQAYATGFFNFAGSDTFTSGPAGPWTRFGYPQQFPIPLQMGPVSVDTIQGAMGPSEPEYFLAYSYSPDRSDPKLLQGAVLRGEVYIFLATTTDAGTIVVVDDQ